MVETHCFSAVYFRYNKFTPTMRWRLIVLVLSVVIIIIQKSDDVNALQSPIFSRSLRKIFRTPSVMDYRA